MQLRSEQLGAHLARGALAPCYVVAGDEALLAIEAQDAIRAAARAQGFTEREVLYFDGRSDWSALEQAASGLSLFGERKLLEVRLPGGKPGKNGAAALQAHAQRNDPGTLTLLSLPRLDGTARKSEWVRALQAGAVWIEVETLARERLPTWIAARLSRQGQSADAETLAFLADQIEGNLLAAHQEITKLRLLYPEGALALEQVRAAVFDVARFEGAALPAAMLEGDRARILRTIAGLRAEGEPLPLLLWWVGEELRGLVRAQQGGGGWVPRRPGAPAPALVERALARTDAGTLAALLARCARLDRVVKGLRVPECDDDPWLELSDIALGLAPEAQRRGARAPGAARAAARTAAPNEDLEA